MIKKLLGIAVLGLLLSTNAYANIFKCTTNDGEITYVIKVEEGEQQSIASLNAKGEFDENSEIYAVETMKGEIIKFQGNKSEVYNLLVTYNAPKGHPSSFRAVFFDGLYEAYLNSVKIKTWEEDYPFYIYSDFNEKITEGKCK